MSYNRTSFGIGIFGVAWGMGMFLSALFSKYRAPGFSISRILQMILFLPALHFKIIFFVLLLLGVAAGGIGYGKTKHRTGMAGMVLCAASILLIEWGPWLVYGLYP